VTQVDFKRYYFPFRGILSIRPYLDVLVFMMLDLEQ